MAEGKNPAYSEIEQSLISFLCQKKEIETLVNGGSRRVRSLTFNMDLKDPKRPLFTVQIGMCEAAFNAITGLREKGNCYGLERFIRDWFERPSVKQSIQAIIASKKKK